MGRNLEEAEYTKMLYHEIIEERIPTKKAHLQLSGPQKNNEKARHYTKELKHWITNEYPYLIQADIKKATIKLYNSLTCIFQDSSDPTKNLDLKAYATSKWSHLEANERFDFVAIKNLEPQEGLKGLQIGRLRLLGSISLPNGSTADVAVVKMLVRVFDKALLPCYEYKQPADIQVIPTDRILRTVAAFPDWRTPIHDLTGADSDLMDKYERIMINSHTDAHAWSTFRDIDD